MIRSIKWSRRTLTFYARLKPSFIIIGAARSGTTSLYNYLSQHPCILPAYRKEPTYFANLYHKKNMIWYRAHFPTFAHKIFMEMKDKFQKVITGEASTYYLFYPYTAQRVNESLPSIKIIVMLRNPVDRAYSQYTQNKESGFEHLSFEEAIELEEERLKKDLVKLKEDHNYDSFELHKYSYFKRSTYVDQLKIWAKYFQKEQMKIIKSEEFYENTNRIYNETLEFLGLSRFNLNDFRKYSHVDYKPMNPTTRKKLIGYFKPHNERLYEFLNRDFHWEDE